MHIFEMATDSAGATRRGDRLMCFVRNCGEDKLGLAPNARYVARMVRIPDDRRLATEDDRKRPLPEGTLYLNECGSWAEFLNPSVWGRLDKQFVCTVPVESETVEVQVLGKKKTITRAQAKSLGLLD